MLALKIAGRYVDLPADFSVTMNLKSPVFGDVGSFSYPFRLPNSLRNKIIFGYRHRVENTGDPYQSKSGVFEWNRLPFYSGTVRTRIANSSTIEGNLLEGSGDFNAANKAMSLQDFDYGQLGFASEVVKFNYINWCKGRVYPEVPYAFPQVLNKSYFEDLPENEKLWYFNYHDNGTIPMILPGSTDRNIVVPMIYLRFVLATIFASLDYTLDDQFFTSHADFNKLSIFNLVDCNSGSGGYFLYDNLKIYRNYHVPRMKLSDFLDGLEKMFNIRFFPLYGSRKVKLVSVDQMVKATDYIEFSDRIISIETQLDDRPAGFHLKMQVDSDDEIWNLLKGYEEIYIKNIKESVDSISELNPWPSDGNGIYRFVTDQNKYYRMYNKLWQPFGEFNFCSQYVYKGKDQTIETKHSTLFGSSPIDGSMAGNARESWQDMQARLFFSVHESSVNNRMIAYHETAYNGLYFGNTGQDQRLYRKHYHTYLTWIMSTKLVRFQKLMTFSELRDFDFSRKYMVNGTKYLVKSIQVTLKKDRISPATLECYPCN